MSRALPQFVPVSASELAAAGARPGIDEPLTFLGDVQVTRGADGAATLVHALGHAVPGRLMGQHVSAPPALAARAVRADGTLEDVAVAVPVVPGAVSAPVGVFVYGTLMRGEEREGAIRSVLPDTAPTDGWVTGSLVHLGAWPGLVGGTGRVHGELYRTTELAALLGVLDPIEDFVDFGALPTEYVRVVVPVTTGADLAWAWTYRYVGDVSDSLAIPSGRFRDAPRRLSGASGMRRRTDAV